MSTSDHLEAFTHALRRLGTLYARLAAHQSAAHGMFTKQELMAIDALGLDGPARMGYIAERLGLGQSAVTPIVDRLEERGLVSRMRSQTDRRVWLVELTANGRRAFAEEDGVYRQVAGAMLAPLDNAERATLTALLQKITLAADLPE